MAEQLCIVKFVHKLHGTLYAHLCTDACKDHPTDVPTCHLEAAAKVTREEARKIAKVWSAFWLKNEPEVKVTIEDFNA